MLVVDTIGFSPNTIIPIQEIMHSARCMSWNDIVTTARGSAAVPVLHRGGSAVLRQYVR